MKLRSKVLFVLSLGLIGLSGSFYVISRTLLTSGYAQLEQQQTDQDVQRVLDALSQEVDNVSRFALDYAKWDETYRFIEDRNQEYIDSTFTNYIDALQMNAILYVDDSNKVAFSLGADLAAGKEASVSQALLNQLNPAGALVKHADPQSSTAGIVQLPEGPMLIGSRPIVTSEGEGPIRGSVIMGRYLNDELLQELGRRTKLPNLAIERFDSTQLPSDFQQARQALTGNSDDAIVVQALDQQSVAGYALIKDISGNPAFLLRVVEPRDIYAQGQASSNYLILAILVTGSVFSVVILFFLERNVLSRLSYLSSGVTRIGSRGISNERVTLAGNDELSNLATTFNSVLDQLQTYQTSLQENATRLQQQNQIVADLSRDESLVQGDLKQVSYRFTEVLAETLEIERVSIWLYNSNLSQLDCMDLYERSVNQHFEGFSRSLKTAPRYFEALITDGILESTEAQTDPRAIDLVDYLQRHNIVSILHFPIQSSGRRVGVVCCEQVCDQRQWQPEEQTFIYSIANLVALALESETLQREVGHLLEIVSSVGNGDLRVQAEVSDRITGLVSDVFNHLIERLIAVLHQVLEAAHQVSTGANQQKNLAETVATYAKQQAESIREVLHLTEQIEQTANDSIEKVTATSESLRAVSTTVERGQSAISAMTEGIDVLQSGTDRIMQQMKTLGEFVGLADQFVQDQSQIAFVTQTLALNASLVAARASEQRDPRQFIVVAREFDSIAEQVSKLAQQTNEGLVTLEQRSNQIHSVVSAIDVDVQNLGELVRGFTQGVDQSHQVFRDVKAVTNEAVQAGEAVAQFNARIAIAAQTTATVMRDIAALSAQTAELTQVSQQQSDQINALSNQLLQSVQFFQLPNQPLSSTTSPISIQISLAQPHQRLGDQLPRESLHRDLDLTDQFIDIEETHPLEPIQEGTSRSKQSQEIQPQASTVEFPLSPASS
ncbi:CHASE4 domain-containing protein [Thermocoleostomius sinensis]|uniref:GAF domain-containing protein n=1 Tax=Thermocoleostomius sinensis A174 TaxID=2016057 RepID=A0A9E8ZEX1_9CYAN|nr:CHASE4 domain-containing protein [Thermocoleostomius sinensis]WAL61903.1 GAF domain-containing protein [Thermocoleostomius sinensis A174]